MKSRQVALYQRNIYNEFFHCTIPSTWFAIAHPLDWWRINGRIVINLCLGVYFAESEDEEFGVVDTVQFSSECLDFGVD